MKWLEKHSSTILTVVASIGVVGTAILSSRATIKAIDILRSTPCDKDPEDIRFSDLAKLTWKCYIPTALVAGASIGCAVGANILSIKAQKNLTDAFLLLNQSYFAYQDKLKELYGEEAHNKIIDEIVKSKCDQKYIYTQSILSTDHLYFDTAEPEITRTFYDSYSNRYFESTISRVLGAEYHLNRNFMLGGNISLNDFYDFLGLEKVDGGDLIGWDMFYGDETWIDFGHQTTTLDDGMEIMVISFVFGPVPLAYD